MDGQNTPGTEDLLSGKDINLILIDLAIAEITSDPSLASARLEVQSLLQQIKKNNVQITPSDLLDKITQIKSRYTPSQEKINYGRGYK